MERIGVKVCHRESPTLRNPKRSEPPSATSASFDLRSPSAEAVVASPTTPRNSQRSTKGLPGDPVSQILIEQSLLGWKEFELEVSDTADNVVIVYGIENLDDEFHLTHHRGAGEDPDGPRIQRLRDQSIAIIREIGVATGRAAFSSPSIRTTEMWW